MFLVSNDKLNIPNFLQALGFIPPPGFDVNEVFVSEENVPYVDDTLKNFNFEAKAVNPQYKTVKYVKKDPKLSHSFSDNYIAPEVLATELVEFPKHVQKLSKENAPGDQYQIIKSPIKAITIAEDTKNNCYFLKITEDNKLLPKGTVLKMNENEEQIPEINYASESINDSNTNVGDISKAALYAYLLANDIRTMHLHAVGDDFDKIHEISQVLYEEAESEFDDLAELAISNGETIPNPILAAQYVDTETEWPPLVGETFNWPQFINNLQNIGTKYIEILKSIDHPVVDDFIVFWDKEISYKNAARGFGHEDEVYEADYLSNLEDPELNFNANDEDVYDISDKVLDMYIDRDEKANNYSWNNLEPMSTSMLISGGEEVDNVDNEEDDKEDTNG